MTKKLIILIAATITVVLLTACAGETDFRNMAPDASREPYVYNTSDLSGEEALELVTPPPTPAPYFIEYKVIHSEENPIGTPGVESTTQPDGTTVYWDSGPSMADLYSGYKSMYDLTDALARAYTAVYGRVVNTYDIRSQNYYFDENGERVDAGSSTMAVIELEVYENYIDKELKFSSGNIIRILYTGSMPSKPCNLRYQFKKNDECILIIAQHQIANPDEATESTVDFYNEFPYFIQTFDDSAIMEKVGDKFNAYGLMMLNKGETYIVNKETGRPVELYSKAEIDAVIKANIDKMRSLSVEAYLEERYVRFEAVD